MGVYARLVIEGVDSQEARDRVAEAVTRNMPLFAEALETAKRIGPVLPIREERASQRVIVAADGGHNAIESFPFMSLGAIRVVNERGKVIFFDVVGPRDDIDLLSEWHLDPANDSALGRMMNALEVKKLYELSTMIPSPAKKGDREKKRKRSTSRSGWMTVYRDLCEWAAVYDVICHEPPPRQRTVILRDGLLRTKIFASALFVTLGQILQERIQTLKSEHGVDLSLVGIAKRTDVQDRFGLALQMLKKFPLGQAFYAPIPIDVQQEVYVWPEYTWLPDDVSEEGRERATAQPSTSRTEEPRYNIGSMHFVRWGADIDDPVWTVDTLWFQSTQADRIFGSILPDTRQSFPIPGYPKPLIDADEGAQISDLDAELLRDYFMDAASHRLSPVQRSVLEAQILNVDYAARRYSQ